MSSAKRYNTGKTRFELIPRKPLELLAEVYTKGAHKYTVYADEQGNRILGKDISVEEVAKRKLIILEDGSDNWRSSGRPRRPPPYATSRPSSLARTSTKN